MELPRMSLHAAVCVKNCIIVFGGMGENEQLHSLNNIWMYNINTEHWRKYVIPGKKIVPPGNTSSCAVAIQETVFVFGGYIDKNNFTNAVWKLSVSKQCFEWSRTKTQSKDKTPSPRYFHTGWEYAGQLWTFGGTSTPLTDYLNDHGDFNGIVTNQLLCFNPLSEEWRNPQSSGAIPSPRTCTSTTMIGNKVWMHGGSSQPGHYFNDLHQLDMASLTWTKIRCEQLKPSCRDTCSLNAVSEHQLILHGGETKYRELLDDTWIFDLLSLSWRQYNGEWIHPWCGHTGTTCMNSSVVLIGGFYYYFGNNSIGQFEFHNDVISLRLAPKKLQQLAIQIIHQHHDLMTSRLLPKPLRDLFLFPVMDACTIE